MSQFRVEKCEDVQPEGTGEYFVVLGPATGAPWEQSGFANKGQAESAKELCEKVHANALRVGATAAFLSIGPSSDVDASVINVALLSVEQAQRMAL